MDNNDAADREELKSRLEGLHRDLQSASEITASERELLSNMVVGVLGLDDQKMETEQGLQEMLEEKSSAWEVKHPKLAFTMRQIIDLLSRIGV